MIKRLRSSNKNRSLLMNKKIGGSSKSLTKKSNRKSRSSKSKSNRNSRPSKSNRNSRSTLRTNSNRSTIISNRTSRQSKNKPKPNNTQKIDWSKIAKKKRLAAKQKRRKKWREKCINEDGVIEEPNNDDNENIACIKNGVHYDYLEEKQNLEQQVIKAYNNSGWALKLRGL